MRPMSVISHSPKHFYWLLKKLDGCRLINWIIFDPSGNKFFWNCVQEGWRSQLRLFAGTHKLVANCTKKTIQRFFFHTKMSESDLNVENFQSSYKLIAMMIVVLRNPFPVFCCLPYFFIIVQNNFHWKTKWVNP